MATRRLAAEWTARLVLVVLAVGIPLLVLFSRNSTGDGAVVVRAAMPEAGGWLPGDLEAEVGKPLHLHLTSTDVVHGFAIGQRDLPAVDLYPGETKELVLTFDQPGTYTYYCTRWCGVNHWRMRGTIEVTGPGEPFLEETTPLYLALGIDLDAPRNAAISLAQKPAAYRGAVLNLDLPEPYLGWDSYVSQNPYQLFQALRIEPDLKNLSENQAWDLVAWIYQMNATPEDLETGARLYAENCSACHGESGHGDGVMADRLAESGIGGLSRGTSGHGHNTVPPTDFTDPGIMLAASPALLQGKILRGGMGTGMPYWGPIFTEAETWGLVAYLWTFQFSFDDPAVGR